VEKLKLKQSQTSQPSEPVKVEETPKEIEGLDIDVAEPVKVEAVEPVKVEAVEPVKPVVAEPIETNETDEEKARNQVLMEIEMLQNNGRFRVELLHQMQEINQALVIIAGALVNDK